VSSPQNRATRDGERPRGSARTRQIKVRRAPMPHDIKPMLATLVAEPFDRAGWLFEIKWDGYRAIAEVEKGRVRLYSRNLLSFGPRYPCLVRALEKLGHDAVLDGEIVVLNPEGKPRFQLLQNYQKKPTGALVYCVFDLLWLDGQDLRNLPLKQRKELLATLLPKQSALRLSEHVEKRGIAFFDAIAKHGLEGIVAKNGDSPYREGARGWDWLKIKTRQRQEAVIGGFTRPRRSRLELGALVLGVFDHGELVYIGHAGSGFNASSLRTLRAKLEPLIQKECPFKDKPKTNAPVQWVKPVLVCEVAFQEWTEDGDMRHPVFLGLREDKPAQAVSRAT
jgi:bifunctional non-homologous end joining protein LigD